MDIVIKDDESRKGYCLVGDILFCALISRDGSIDSNSWHPIEKNLSPYHHDMIEKLRGLINTRRSLRAPIADFPII